MKLAEKESLELETLTAKMRLYSLSSHESIKRDFLVAKKLADPSELEDLREWQQSCEDDLQPYLGGGGDDW